ncbi:MAG: hypothetical protein AB1847_14905 [bacterium]
MRAAISRHEMGATFRHGNRDEGVSFWTRKEGPPATGLRGLAFWTRKRGPLATGRCPGLVKKNLT